MAGINLRQATFEQMEAAPVFETTEDGGEVIAETDAFQLMDLSIPPNSAEARHVKPVKLLLVRYAGGGHGQPPSAPHHYALHIVKPVPVDGHTRFALSLDATKMTLTPGDVEMVHPVPTVTIGDASAPPAHMTTFKVHRTDEGILNSAISAVAGLGSKHKLGNIKELGLAFPNQADARGWWLGTAVCMGIISKDDPHFVKHSRDHVSGMQTHVTNRLLQTWLVDP